MTTASLIQRLSAHLARSPNESDRARARLHLLDWLACVAGARQAPVAAVARMAEPDMLTRAALLGNVLEMDDVHRAALLHPGPVIWPAALSAARQEKCGMDALLDGAVRGYEAMIAIGATFDAHHYAHFHPTSTAGGFGGAAAAASIFALDEAATGWALGNAASVAGGLWRMRHEDVMTKAMHAARAALEGLWLARLAREGFTGPAQALEGEQGLYAAMVREPKPMALGEEWLIHAVSFKPWAACRHAHPAIDAALELREAGKLHLPVTVETYADALKFCDRPHPVTELDAKFSIQHAVAVIADGRSATPEDFTPDAIAALSDQRAQVTVHQAAEFTAAYPQHFGARVTSDDAVVTLADTRGDPERPAGPEMLRAKLDSLVSWGGLKPVEAERAAEIALNDTSVGPLLALLEDWLE
ncbi:2-methylcitrate dehydratase PrpD [Blastomonas natatoria]|uniref:2-methylcitrate dehydratase PrpD n=1 Tax=Blastomonas natatoria TaxID=34015 RepID=A0A2V3V3F9_9SPHN|nr:MmgE/PrpD family protein [Blastomonas natatoria]PXW76266.1 2-methylcitrate dehydratase PrpD [Blastomonas natatoria]